MAALQTKDSDSLVGVRKFWIFLLLLVLIVVLVVYDQGAVKEYGEKAYTKVSSLAEKANRWTKERYRCGLLGCKSEQSPAAVPMAPVQATQPGMAQLPPEAPPPTAAETDGNKTAAAPALPAPAPSPGLHADSTAASSQPSGGEVNYPAYPAYPAYPPYSASGSAGGEKAPVPAPGKTEPSDHSPYPNQPKSPPPAASPVIPAPAATPAETGTQAALLPPPPAAKPGYSKVLPYAAPSESGNSLEPARKSALAGRLGESIHLYLQYLDSHPNDINAHGELGNVYMRIGLNSEAAQNYYEAATRMIDAGQTSAIASLMPIIEMHEPVLAKLLNKKLARITGDVRRPQR